MRIIFIHGINHENRSSEWIIDEWLKALEGALSPSEYGLLKRQTIEAPYYGDVLYNLTRRRSAAKDRLQPQSASEAEGDEAAFYRDALTEVVQANSPRVTPAQIANAEEVVEQGPIYNNRYVIALLKVLEDVLPDHGAALLKVLPQAFVYLNRMQATAAVDEIVRPILAEGPCIVVAHSLGTIVTFKLMRELKQVCPFYMTMGSPLAIKAVQGPVRVPFGRRPAVTEWHNVWDPDDLVTLSSPLDGQTFGAGVDNTKVNNGNDDAHDFRRYLGHPEIAQRLVAAIRNSA